MTATVAPAVIPVAGASFVRPLRAGDGVQIGETTGALYVNGAAASSVSLGSLVVTDANDGDLTITLTPALTAALPAGAMKSCVYDIQLVGGASVVETLTSGVAYINADVTRTVPS